MSELQDSSPDSSYEGSVISGDESERLRTPITAPQTPRTPRPSDLKTIQCPYEDCPKSFNRQARLIEHLRSHTNDRPFKCSAKGCDKNFLRESHLKHHLKSAHSAVRDYVCDWEGCDKKFATGTRLRRHKAAHEEKEKYRCRGYEGCNETFRKHATLKHHILSFHQNIKPFPCELQDPETGDPCTQAFDTAERLRAHHRRRHDEGRFTCTECPQSSSFDSEYQILKEQLTGEATEPADTVQQPSFPTYALLQAHIAAVHPPTCPQCSVICSTQRELRRHIESEHGISHNEAETEVFVCSHCTRQFLKKGNLNVHIKTVHDGNRDFLCGQTDLSTSKNVPSTLYEGCGRSFTSKGSLEEHTRTAHLGLLSNRAERKRARRDAEGEDDTMPKKRKTVARKGKSALEAITGVPESAVIGVEEEKPSFYEPAGLDAVSNFQGNLWSDVGVSAGNVSADAMVIDPLLL